MSVCAFFKKGYEVHLSKYNVFYDDFNALESFSIFFGFSGKEVIMQEPLTIFFGIILAAFILGWFYFRKPPAPTSQRADLRLEGNFSPSQVHIHSGLPLHLHIHRVEGEPEEEWVRIPELKIEEPLPPMMTTVVHLESLPVGSFVLKCRQGKAQSLLIVEERE